MVRDRAERASLRRGLWQAAALLFLSGVAGLVYQVLWIKQLSLVVGVDIHAVTIGVSAFFGGLALGGWVVGRLADRAPSAWRLYLWLECAIAVLAIGATLCLAHAAAPFAWLESRVGGVAWALPVLLVGLPAIAMGGTLPALMRAVRTDGAQMGAHGGQLYAANTAGAIVGTLLAAFVWIPQFGITGSAVSAALLNALAAFGAWWFGRGATLTRGDARAAGTTASHRSGQRMLALGLYALAGGIALGYEVVWSQAMVQFMSTRAFAFAVMLATYLAGLVIGSAMVARRVDRASDPWGMFALLIVGAGLAALVEFAWLGEWLPSAQQLVSQRVLGATGSLLAATCASFAVAALCVVFVPTLLLGAAFPYVVRLSVDPARVGTGVGTVLALNTVGGIAGSVLAGFGLVPWLGVVETLGVLAAAGGFVAVLAVAFGDGVQRSARFAVPLLAVITLIVAVATPADRFATLLAKSRGGSLVVQKFDTRALKFTGEPVPVADTRKEGFVDRWVVYGKVKGKQYFTAKELTVDPGVQCTVKDRGAYGLICVQGSGSINGQPLNSPKLIRFTELTEDEYFCTADGARSGVTFANTSETEPLVCLRYFGPDVNPDAPVMGAYRKNKF